jgi:hypothetical protein
MAPKKALVKAFLLAAGALVANPPEREGGIRERGRGMVEEGGKEVEGGKEREGKREREREEK